MAIDGTYKCQVITHGNDELQMKLISYGVMKLYQQDDQLKGSMFPVFFWYQAPFRNGYTDGKRFKFTVYFNSPCQQYAMDVEGEVSEDGKIKGIATNPMGTCELIGEKISDEVLARYPRVGRI